MRQVVRITPKVQQYPPTVPAFASTAFQYQPLPANVALDTDDIPNTSTPLNPAVGQELARQAVSPFGAPYLNEQDYTAVLYQVPLSTPFQRVKLMQPSWNGVVPSWAAPLAQAMQGEDANGNYIGGGVPIDPSYVPNAGTDHEACFHQPDYVGPSGEQGRYWECWKLVVNTGSDAGTYPWTAEWGGKAIGLPGVYPSGLPGHWTAWQFSGYEWQTPGNPDSTYREADWGTTATSLPLRDMEITVNDLGRGRIDHAIGLAVPQSAPAHRWPAQRHDGSVAGNPLNQGMRLCFEPGYAAPAGLHPVCEAIINAGIPGPDGYGYVIWDTAGVLSFRCEPGAAQFWNGTHDYSVLDGFPWQDLKVIVTGSDAAPVPTA